MVEVVRVAASVVLLRVADRVEYLYTNTVIPEGADAGQVARLLSMGMLVKDAALEAPVTPSQPETPEGQGSQAVASGVVDYSTMEYGVLQTLAKERGVSANQSREALVKALSA